MYLAAFGDILSNNGALQQIMNHFEDEGIHHVVHTGNICLFPEGARECVERLRTSSIQAVQGRLDRALISRKAKAKRLPEAADLEKSYATLTSADIEYLAGLPRKRSFTRESIVWLVCHGSLNRPSEILTGESGSMKFQRQREETTAQVIITGGAEEPFCLTVEGSLFVSPGTLLTRDGKIRYTLIDTETVPYEARIIYL
jgi:predicted phosphodiesterase